MSFSNMSHCANSINLGVIGCNTWDSRSQQSIFSGVPVDSHKILTLPLCYCTWQRSSTNLPCEKWIPLNNAVNSKSKFCFLSHFAQIYKKKSPPFYIIKHLLIQINMPEFHLPLAWHWSVIVRHTKVSKIWEAALWISE